MPSFVLMWNAQDRYGSYHHRAFNSIGKKSWSPKQSLLSEITLLTTGWTLSLSFKFFSLYFKHHLQKSTVLMQHTPYTHTHTHTHTHTQSLFAYIIWNQIPMSRIVLSISKKLIISRFQDLTQISLSPQSLLWLIKWSLSSEHP